MITFVFYIILWDWIKCVPFVFPNKKLEKPLFLIIEVGVKFFMAGGSLMKKAGAFRNKPLAPA